ncbi:MAG: hypothetical protein JW874_03590 [Spirochaetales bacterium]|nr:hypothetical protein [Spirochaetales bacterium]
MSDLYLEPVEEEQEVEVETSLSTAGFSEDDRNEILAEIDGLVSENRIPITRELFQISPKKKGILLPALINLLAIGIVAGVFLFFRGTYISNQEAENESIINYYTGGAGEILERLRAESEAEIAAKNAEIADIQDKLTALDRQSRELRGNIDSIVEQEKQRLEEEMEQYLAEERQRLQAEGNSTAEIEAKLKEAGQAQERRLEEMLASARSEAEEQIRQREAALENERRLIESQLDNARQERETIENEFEQEMQERQAAFDAEREALAAEASEASLALERLNAQRQQEKGIIAQIDGSFALIIDNMKKNAFENALTGIDNLEALYKNPKITNLPVVAGRMQNDLFTLNAYREQIQMKSQVEDIDTSNLAEAANVLVTTTGYAEQGMKAYSEGNTGEARTTLRQAVEKVPELYEAFETLQKIETVNKTDISKTHLKSGTAYYEQNALTKAVESFQEAAYVVAENNKPEIKEAMNGMSKVYEKLNQQQLYARDQEIRNLTSENNQRKNDINILKTKINEQQTAYEKLSQDYTALLEQKTVATSDSTAAGQQNAALQASLQEVRTELSTLRASHEALRNENTQLSAQLEESRQALDQLTTEHAATSSELARTEAANLELNTALSSNQEILDQTRQENEALSKRNVQLENEIVQVKAAAAENAAEYSEETAAAIAGMQEEISRLREDNTRLNDDLTVSENSAAALNLEIEEYRKNIEELKTSMTAAQGDVDTVASETKNLEQQIAELNAAHEQQVNELNAVLEEVSAGKSVLERENSELEHKLKESNDQLNSTYEIVNRLREETAVFETDLENAIDDSEKNLRQLKKESEAAIAEKDRFINSLISSYINYADKIEAKLAENNQNSINEADHLLGSFLNNENINALFPGFSPMLDTLQTRRLDLERNAIEARARDEALNDVLVASRYFSGNTGSNSGTYLTTINSLSSKEEKYREIVEAYQSMALRGEIGKITDKQTETILIGSVVSVSSGEMIIEPLIYDLSAVKEGDVINIRRKDRYGRETEITQARITSIRNGRVSASFTDTDITKRPLTADLVYMK